MTEYIEREKAWRKVNRAKSIEDALNLIDGLPSTDVVPVKWISVKDRLPDEEERVLVAVDSDKSDTKIDTDRMMYRQWVRWGMSVTHWMPLPEPPKKPKEEESAE